MDASHVELILRRIRLNLEVTEDAVSEFLDRVEEWSVAFACSGRVVRSRPSDVELETSSIVDGLLGVTRSFFEMIELRDRWIFFDGDNARLGDLTELIKFEGDFLRRDLDALVDDAMRLGRECEGFPPYGIDVARVGVVEFADEVGEVLEVVGPLRRSDARTDELWGVHEDLCEMERGRFRTQLGRSVRRVRRMLELAIECWSFEESLPDIGGISSDATAILQLRERAVLITWEGEELDFGSSGGFIFIAELIRRSPKGVDARELVALVDGGNVRNDGLDEKAVAAFGEGGAGSELHPGLMDDEDVAEQRRNLRLAQQELAEAIRSGDAERKAELERVRNLIAGEIEGGRRRDLTARKAGDRVGKAIRVALKEMRGRSDSLWRHFKASLVRPSGVQPQYLPASPVNWVIT